MRGIGIDLCEISRMEKILNTQPRFLEKYFTENERAYINKRGKMSASSMAGIYAAKEALLKALGIGIGTDLRLEDISIVHGPHGEPKYQITDRLKEKLANLGATYAFLSITHDAGVAAAVAFIE